MKRNIFCVLVLMTIVAAPCFAQSLSGRSNPGSRGVIGRKTLPFDKNPNIAFKQTQLRSYPFSEDEDIVYSEDRTFVYLGGSGTSETRGPFASGYGLARYVSQDGQTQQTEVVYCLCPWKRGSRHGYGLMRCADGSVVKARWRWDTLKAVLDEPPTEEEVAELNRQIQRLEKALKLF